MKIIGTDNFGRDEVNETIMAENVPECYAESICNFVNEKYSGVAATRFYVVQPDDYQPFVWEP